MGGDAERSVHDLTANPNNPGDRSSKTAEMTVNRTSSKTGPNEARANSLHVNSLHAATSGNQGVSTSYWS